MIHGYYYHNLAKTFEVTTSKLLRSTKSYVRIGSKYELHTVFSIGFNKNFSNLGEEKVTNIAAMVTLLTFFEK